MLSDSVDSKTGLLDPVDPATGPYVDDEFALACRQITAHREAAHRELMRQEQESAMCDFLRPALENMMAKEIEELTTSGATRKTYKTDLKRFKKFCDEAELMFRPASPEAVSHFLIEDQRQGAGPERLRRTLSAIAYAHRLARMYDPTADILVRATLRHLTKQEKPNA